MCTALTFTNRTMYFGRNMDIEYHFGEAVAITPRDYPLPTKFAGTLRTRFAMIGMANVTADYPLYAEAANEAGLCAAGLNFPGNAVYADPGHCEGTPVAPYELIPFLLGQCENVSQARELLRTVDIVSAPFSAELPLAPLHWIVSDATGSLTVERTASGIHVYDNPFGVLTNNPPFPFHLENARQYLHLSAGFPENRFSGELPLAPFGQGMGAIGLPGDFSPASRFIKTLFCKANSVCEEDAESCVGQVFHILDAVAMVRGTVITPEGRQDMTTYSCCIDTSSGTYYYKTYSNSRVTGVRLTDERRAGSGLSVFPLRTAAEFAFE